MAYKNREPTHFVVSYKLRQPFIFYLTLLEQYLTVMNTVKTPKQILEI